MEYLIRKEKKRKKERKKTIYIYIVELPLEVLLFKGNNPFGIVILCSAKRLQSALKNPLWGFASKKKKPIASAVFYTPLRESAEESETSLLSRVSGIYKTKF